MFAIAEIGISEAAAAALVGLVGGVLLGLAARRGRFCTLGAIEDALYADDTRRARMWGVALAVAILGVFSLEHFGALDLSRTIYARQAWNPIGAVLGGAAFGYGMAIAGNCGLGALSRAASGEIRSLVIVVVIGVSAYMTLVGPLAPLRMALFPVEPSGPSEAVSIAHHLSEPLGASPLVAAAPIALGFLAWALWSSAFRRSGAQIFWGGAVGVAIVLGWWGTARLSTTGFDGIAVESHTFTAPLGETLLFLMTSAPSGVTFSVGSVLGVVLGAMLGSWSKGGFRWEACDDPRELGRQAFGAFLMGVGGVVALGCSVGQGLTAFSALSWSAPLVAASILAGAAVGLKQLIEGGPAVLSSSFLPGGQARRISRGDGGADRPKT